MSNGIEMYGEIMEILPAGKYKVQLHDTTFQVTWYKAWNMKRNNINILEGDRVKIDVNEYDNTQWRITFRYKARPYELLWEEPPQQYKPRPQYDHKRKPAYWQWWTYRRS